MQCSCKGGAGGCCKHISAFLILLTRKNLSELENISQTELSCAWANVKGSVIKKYKAVCINEMPCIKPNVVPAITVDEDMKKTMLNFFIKKLPKSAIAKHLEGRQTEGASNNLEGNENDVAIPFNFTIIIDNAAQSILMMMLSSLEYQFSFPCCKALYSTILNDSVYNTVSLCQSCTDWYNARQFRITGSRCYEIYTYRGLDWDTKSKKFYWPKSFTNKFVRHGLKYEKDARAAFISQTGHTVIECGMIISPQNKWLGFSPDGIIIDTNGNPVALLEIKCIYSGSSTSIEDAIQSCSYITKENGVYRLKKNHKYYGQVQFGMAILNVPKSYLVLYASFDMSLVIIDIEYNFEFTWEMLSKVKTNYFSKMIHAICESKSE
ncbi:uncharacterized protein LOC115877238 [Sitophilus oryzae]|uniref:Uncharacterized protein LOC115877238 n=1 Tax=Sitophilus oryzae TaxID=7048 RepID=A0A6J2XDD5_SITOR|nr:uncharacterized protein LOC115877238 [Sitophilus oryzae]